VRFLRHHSEWLSPALQMGLSWYRPFFSARYHSINANTPPPSRSPGEKSDSSSLTNMCTASLMLFDWSAWESCALHLTRGPLLAFLHPMARRLRLNCLRLVLPYAVMSVSAAIK
jgi:hypothetical protein